MASFTDYYQAELQKLSGAPSAASVGALPKTGRNSQVQTPPDLSPLGVGKWLLDIIDRPRNAIANVGKNAIDRGVAAGEAFSSGDALGGVANTAGAVLGSIPALLNGLLSANPDDKHSTADLIEYATDTIGKASNPDYVDRLNNVSPVVKGITGFTGDVLLDPLTYIPGAALLKGAKATAKSVDGALEVASKASVGLEHQGLAEALKAPWRPADKGVVAASKEAVAAADGVKTADKITDATKAAEREAADAVQPDDFLDSTPTPGVSKVLSETVADAPAPPRQGLLPIPKNLLDKTPEAKLGGGLSMPKTVPVSATQQLQSTIENAANRSSVQDFLAHLSEKANPVAVPETLNGWVKTLPESKSIPGAQNAQSRATVKDFNELMAQGSAAKQALLAAQKVGDVAAESTAKGVIMQTQKAVAPLLGRLREAHAKALAEPNSPISQQSAFQALVDDNSKAVAGVLGQPLLAFLERSSHSPKKFDSLIESVRGITDAGPNVATIHRTMDRTLSNLLSDHLGLPRVSRPSTPEEISKITDALFQADDDLTKAVSKAVQDAIKDEIAKGNYPFLVTAKNGMVVARTSLTKGEGLGRYVDQFNTFTQYSIVHNLRGFLERISAHAAAAKGSKAATYAATSGKANAALYREAKIRALDEATKTLDQLGISVGIGVGTETSMVSLVEIYRAVIAAAAERGTPLVSDLALFNGGSKVADTALMTAMNAAMHGAGRDEVLAMLSSTRKLGAKGALDGAEGTLYNAIAAPKKNSAYRWGAESEKLVADKGALAGALADLVMDAAAPLKVRAAENLSAYLARSSAEAADLTGASLKRTEDVLADTTGVVAKTEALGSWRNDVYRDGAAVGATPDALDASVRMAEASMGKDMAADIAGMHQAQRIATQATSVEELSKASDVIGDRVAAEVSDEIRTTGSYHGSPDAVDSVSVQDVPAGAREAMSPSAEVAQAFEEAGTQASKKSAKKDRAVNLTKNSDKFVDAYQARVQDPYGLLKHKVQTWFNQNYKMGSVHPVFAQWQGSMALRAEANSAHLNAIYHLARKAAGKDGDSEALVRSAFANVQRGASGQDPASAELERMISGVLKDFFSLEETGAMANSFLRVSGKVGVVNAVLARKGLDPEKYAFNEAAATVGKTLDPKALAAQWKAWDVKDPLDFMRRLNLAREELALDAGVGRSYVQLAKDLGAFSDKPAPGFVRLRASGQSRFIAHIPEGTYVKKELALELQQLETMLRTSREFGGELGTFVREVYAPLLNGWKRSITINRLGHHVRNYIGSTSATWVRRGFGEFKRSHTDAYKILLQKNDYAGANMLAAAEYNGITSLPQKGDVLLSLGLRGNLTVDEAYAYLASGGALPSFRVGEDFLDQGGKLGTVVSALTLENTKYGKVAGSLSEYTDHFTRAQHFMQALRQDAKRFPGKSKKQLMETALAETQKYHPDGTMLTTTEAKLRLLIPFYTWFSKMMPALVESAVMHPGRVVAPVRASYAVQTALGMDPTSLQDPFPQDQLFPSFIKENPLGPQMNWGGSYVRMDPGFAHLDVLNTFGADPFRGLLGMTSPLLRVPIELAAGSSIATGTKIKDTSDYIDQNLPGINYLSNLTGTSFTGSLGSLPMGKGLDPQAGFVPKADGTTNKSNLDQILSALNWTSGLGFQNLSRPNYINYAEIEQRNQGGKSGQ